MDRIDIDDLPRVFYAAVTSVQDVAVGEVEFEHEKDGADYVFRISVRRGPRAINSNTYINSKSEGEGA